MRITVHIKPNAKHASVEEKDGVVEVAVHASPTEGKTDEEMVELLSDYFEVAKSAIEIVSGHTVRKKIVEIRSWQKR